MCHDCLTNWSSGCSPARAELLSRDRADQRAYPRNRVGREDGLSGVLPNELFVRRTIDAVDLVIGDVTVNPLNGGPKLAQHRARGLNGSHQFIATERAGTRHVSFDDKLRHAQSPTRFR